MDYATFIIQLVGGVAGSGIAATTMRRLNLSGLGNVLVGLVGGGLGGQILGNAFGTPRMIASTGLDPGLVISEIASGAAGGAGLLAAVAVLHRTFAK